MKKIGVITSAIGFIFIGLVLGIRIINPLLAMNLLKFWFVIFIVLGVEVIVLNKKYDNPKFSKLSIFVILLLIGLRGYFAINKVVVDEFPDIKSTLGELTENIKGEFNKADGVKINDEIVLEPIGHEIDIDSRNGNVTIIHSKDGKIKLESEITLKKNINKDQYKLNYKKSKDGYGFNFSNRNIKKANLILYIPDKYKIKLDLTNGDIECKSENLKADYDIDLVNGYIKLIGDINKSKISCVNGDIDIDNKEFKELKIENVNGDIKLNTIEKNLNISVKSTTGKCNFNGEQSKSIEKKEGNGSAKLEIDVTNGDVNVNSKS